MTDKAPGLEELVAAVWPQAGLVDAQRMAELAGEVRAVVQAGRRAAQGNAFEDEPSRFTAVLHSLAEPDEAGDA